MKEVDATSNNMTTKGNHKVLLERRAVPISEHEGASAITGALCYCCVVPASLPKATPANGISPSKGLKPRPSLMLPGEPAAAP